MSNILETSWRSGKSFVDFFRWIQDLHKENLVTGQLQNEDLLEYSLLNEKRMSRLIKHGQAGEVVENDARGVAYALVITEGWCGDSAQTLPFFDKWCAMKGVELRIVGRDDNESLMDQYLTNGSRSIPIMIGLDNQFKEIFRWGPRPAILAEKIKEWKESGLEKKEMGLLMHQWYTENKGQAVWQEWEAM